MSAITVLYVSHTSHVSGGERSLLDLLPLLPPAVRPVVASPAGDLAERVGALGVELHRTPGTDASLRLRPVASAQAVAAMARAALAVRRIARRTGADLLHANSIRAGLVASLASALGAPPAVVHVRDRLPPGPVSTLVLGLLARRAAALIGNSSYVLVPIGSGPALRRVIHSPVDLQRFAPGRAGRAEARRRIGVAERGPILGVVGQLTPWKAQDDAVRVVGLLRPRFPRIRLLVVGSAKFVSAETRFDNRAYVEELHRLVHRLGLEGHVAFLGEREDVPEILAALDVLLVPSWEEPFGRVVAEAMAMGVPVAATEVGGPREIMESGREGLLLPPRAPGRWAAALAPLLGGDPSLEEMGRAGAARASGELGASAHAARVTRVYEEVLMGSRSRPGQQ